MNVCMYGCIFQSDRSFNGRHIFSGILSLKGCYRSFCGPLDEGENIRSVAVECLSLRVMTCAHPLLLRPQIGAVLTSAASNLDGFKASAVFKEIGNKLEQVPRVNHSLMFWIHVCVSLISLMFWINICVSHSSHVLDKHLCVSFISCFG